MIFSNIGDSLLGFSRMKLKPSAEDDEIEEAMNHSLWNTYAYKYKVTNVSQI